MNTTNYAAQHAESSSENRGRQNAMRTHTTNTNKQNPTQNKHSSKYKTKTNLLPVKVESHISHHIIVNPYELVKL
jgi:hypothetical protein